MRVYSIGELMRLTKIDLCGLLRRIIELLSELPEGTPEREAALINLRNIRAVLARRHYSP